MGFMKRLTACLLCVVLLFPGACLAEDEAQALRFDVAFDMDASAYPAQDQALLGGIADMLNMLTLSGVYTWRGKSFDLDADLLLDGSEDTCTNLHLYGLDSHWELASSLLGDLRLKFNMLGYLEFAIKAYFHMNLPLQYIALCTSPFATESAFWVLKDEWNTTLYAGKGTRLIPRKKVMTLAEQLAETSASDRSFEYWVKALTLELGYDSMIFDGLATLPDWADSFLGQDGIRVKVAGGVETWATNGMTLFTRTVDGADEAWSLTLPATLDGYMVTAEYTRQGSDTSLHIGVTMEEENDLLDVTVCSAGLTEGSLPTGAFSLAVDLDGEMLGTMAQHLRFEGTRDGDAFTLTQKDAADGRTMLTLRGTLTEEPATLTPEYTPESLDGMDIFSISDYSLGELVEQVKEPMLRGLLPLLVHLPASSFDSIFQLLDTYGVLSLLGAAA